MSSSVSDEVLTSLHGKIVEETPKIVLPHLQMLAIRNTMTFLACNAYRKFAQKRLTIGHIIDNMIYCHDFNDDPIDSESIAQITAIIESEIAEKAIAKVLIPKEVVVKFFAEKGHSDTVEIIKSLGKTEIECACLGKYIQPVFGPIECDLTKLGEFRLQGASRGFIIELPGLLDNGKLREWSKIPSQHMIIENIAERVRALKARSIPELNNLVVKHQIQALNHFTENFQKFQMDSIINYLLEHPEKRVISIAGASSSGKSTFAHALISLLAELGHPSLIMSMDNYFVDRVDTPLDEDGNMDFESVYSIHLHLMGDRIKALLDGEEAPKREYVFLTGKGHDLEETMKLDPNGFLIIEGIHGLNPVIMDLIGEDKVTKIYVSPMMPLAIDAEHCFDPSDLLLIRRIIRDFTERGYSARKNLRWWPDVVKGTWRNIIPNIGQADLFYDSSLVYEMSKLTKEGIEIFSKSGELMEDETENELSKEITQDGNRILQLFQFLKPLAV